MSVTEHAKIKWTPAQKLAQRKRGNTLVSAAAGSGKTAALTEKIIRLLTKCDARLDQMLIVTFTRAAAEELRVKIEKRLMELVASDHTAAFHLNDLPGAEIGTIHSFCRRILAQNYVKAGVSPGFAVMADGEEKTLIPRAVDEAFDDLFSAPSSDPDENTMGISGVCDVLGGIEEAEKTAARIYQELRTRGFGAEKLEEYAVALESAAERDFFSTPWGKLYRDRITEAVRHFTEEIDFLIPLFDNEKHVGSAERLAEWLGGIEKAAGAGFAAFKRSYASFGESVPQNRSKNAAAAQYKNMKNEAVKFFDGIAGGDLVMTQEQISSVMKRTARFIRGLSRAVSAFGEKYSAMKADRGKLDYQDLESLAFRLLVGKDGEPTETAVRIGEKYKYIFVDEYQDTNSLQDAIFRAVGVNSERFLVGDIKQSIYSFRGAEPEIFSGYREKWAPVFPDGGEDDAWDPHDAGVFMSENFRCSEPIIRFSNGVSEYMFRNGGIPFCREDELVFRADSSVTAPVSVCLVSKDDPELTEEKFVARTIRDMLGKDLFGTGPLTPSDFAIRSNSANVDGPAFAAELSALGIPSSMSAGYALENESEIVLALDMLRAIDNPYRDGPLAGMMYSSIYGFTLDDLVRIRKKYSDGPFFTAVKRTAEEGGGDVLSGKCSAFCDRMETYRLAERSTPANAFIEYLFSESGITYSPEVTEKPDGVRNLHALLDMARRYEEGVFGGLYGFLNRVDDLIASDSFTASSSKSGAVNILTVHKSKGLEFPVCFFSKTAKRPGGNNGKKPAAFDPVLGIGALLPDSGGFTASNNPIYGAIKERCRDAEVGDGLRKIYVAMTRARSRLFVTAKCNPEKELADAAERSWCDDSFDLRKAGCSLDYILTAMERAPEEIAELRTVSSDAENAKNNALHTGGEEISADVEKAELDVGAARENFDFEYPYAFLAGLPAKTSVSRLYPEALDFDGAAVLPDAVEEREDGGMPYPSFMTGTFGHDPAKRGTANHVFMQFADFSKLRAGDVQGERERLVAEGFMTKEMAELVDLPMIVTFASSDLSRRIAEAAEVRREFRFNVRLPAEKFTSDPDLGRKFSESGTKITVQGVFDCVFREPDGKLVLVDYKTDSMNSFERAHPEAFEEKMRERHKLQLTYYREAACLLFGRTPDEVLIWSLPLGKSVDLTDYT